MYTVNHTNIFGKQEFHINLNGIRPEKNVSVSDHPTCPTQIPLTVKAFIRVLTILPILHQLLYSGPFSCISVFRVTAADVI